MVSIGPPATEARHLYDAVAAAHAAAVAATTPGASPYDIDWAARAVLVERGLGERFGHGTGHGLGLEIHEEPRIGVRRSTDVDRVVDPGMVFTIEPGAYVPGLGGVRIEDDVLVTPDGMDLLTTVPRELLVI
jgi:Xaa-Pro aminopeptidase